MIKYKVHEVAKDLGLQSKAVTDVVEKYFGSTKKSMTALEEEELNVVFDYFTQQNAMESLDSYFAVRDKAIEEKAQAEETAEKEEEKKPAKAAFFSTETGNRYGNGTEIHRETNADT